MNLFRKLAQVGKRIFTGEKPEPVQPTKSVTLDDIMQDIRPGRVTKRQKRGLRRRMRIGRKKARTVTNHPQAGDFVDGRGVVYSRSANGVVTRVTPKERAGVAYSNGTQLKAIKRLIRDARRDYRQESQQQETHSK